MDKPKEAVGPYSIGSRFTGYYKGHGDVSIHDLIIVDSGAVILLVDMQDAVAYELGGSLIGDQLDFFAEDIEQKMSHIGLHIIDRENGK